MGLQPTTLGGPNSAPPERKWQPTPNLFLPGKSCGQRSLAGYYHEVANSRTRQSTLIINSSHVRDVENFSYYCCTETIPKLSAIKQ